MSDSLNPADQNAPNTPRWSLALRLVFRFFFVYLMLYTMPPEILGMIPGVADALQWWTEFKQRIGVAVGQNVFGVTITVFPNGSGDTTYNYVEVFTLLCISLVAAAAWSIIDRRTSHPRAAAILRIVLRYTLALAMLNYGIAKIIPTQFPAPSMIRLTQQFGESSPMGLLWTFMGASVGYNIFAGLGEAVGGLLLFFRRTTLLGSLILVGVLANVVALNFCYDVPVKLYSSHLLLMAIALVLPDTARLAALLILNRPAPASDGRQMFAGKFSAPAWVAFKSLVVAGLLFMGLSSGMEWRSTGGDGAPKGPLQGNYRVEVFEGDGVAIAPLLSETARWNDFVVGRVSPFDQKGTARARNLAGESIWFRYTIDPAARTIELQPSERGNGTAPGASPFATTQGQVGSTLTYEEIPAVVVDGKETSPGALRLSGTWEGKPIRVELNRVPPDAFLLTSRGFHWISEYPFNR